MKLAACSCYVRCRFGASATPDQTVRALEELARLGLRHVELSASGSKRVRAMHAARDRFRFAATHHELDVFAISVSLEGLFSGDEAVRERAFEDFDLAVLTASDLGARFVHLRVPRSADGRKARRSESLSVAARITARYGLVLAIEPSAERAAEAGWAAAAAELIAEADEVNVKAVLDTSPMHEGGADLAAALELLGGRVAYVRTADRNSHGRTHLAPGAGQIDWLATLTLLAQHRYTGYLALQIETDDPAGVAEDFRSGAGYLQSIADRGGFLLE